MIGLKTTLKNDNTPYEIVSEVFVSEVFVSEHSPGNKKEFVMVVDGITDEFRKVHIHQLHTKLSDIQYKKKQEICCIKYQQQKLNLNKIKNSVSKIIK